MEERDSERPAPGRLNTRSVHEGRIVRLSLDRVRFPDGSEGTLEMIRHPGASAVLPVVGSPDEKDPEILLIHQYRYAAGGYIWEVPAGIPKGPDEPWDVCAGRELEEETGQRAGVLRELTRIYTTPGFADEVIHLFMATELAAGERNLDDDEFMEVVRMPMSKALEMVRQGEIVDAKSVATLLFAATFLMGAQEDA